MFRLIYLYMSSNPATRTENVQILAERLNREHPLGEVTTEFRDFTDVPQKGSKETRAEDAGARGNSQGGKGC